MQLHSEPLGHRVQVCVGILHAWPTAKLYVHKGHTACAIDWWLVWKEGEANKNAPVGFKEMQVMLLNIHAVSLTFYAHKHRIKGLWN